MHDLREGLLEPRQPARRTAKLEDGYAALLGGAFAQIGQIGLQGGEFRVGCRRKAIGAEALPVSGYATRALLEKRPVFFEIRRGERRMSRG